MKLFWSFLTKTAPLSHSSEASEDGHRDESPAGHSHAGTATGKGGKKKEIQLSVKLCWRHLSVKWASYVHTGRIFESQVLASACQRFRNVNNSEEQSYPLRERMWR